MTGRSLFSRLVATLLVGTLLITAPGLDCYRAVAQSAASDAVPVEPVGTVVAPQGPAQPGAPQIPGAQKDLGAGSKSLLPVLPDKNTLLPPEHKTLPSGQTLGSKTPPSSAPGVVGSEAIPVGEHAGLLGSSSAGNSSGKAGSIPGANAVVQPGAAREGVPRGRETLNAVTDKTENLKRSLDSSQANPELLKTKSAWEGEQRNKGAVEVPEVSLLSRESAGKGSIVTQARTYVPAVVPAPQETVPAETRATAGGGAWDAAVQELLGLAGPWTSPNGALPRETAAGAPEESQPTGAASNESTGNPADRSRAETGAIGTASPEAFRQTGPGSSGVASPGAAAAPRSLFGRVGRSIRDFRASIADKSRKTARLADSQRVNALRRVLADPPGASPFVFHDSNGQVLGAARDAGLEGFLYSKREIEAAHGREALLEHVTQGDYFRYLDRLLGTDPGFQDLRRQLSGIAKASGSALEIDEQLTQFLIKTVQGLQAELEGRDEALWIRDMRVYEILARSYNRLKPGKDFFDSLDDSELDRIVRDNPGTNTLWINDVFQLGKARHIGTGGGSPYSIMRYSAKPELGGDEGLKAFVRRAHAKGLRVMMDVVPNHTSPDSDLVKTHPEAFVHIVPPQGLSDEDMLRLAPKEANGSNPAYYLVETDQYPENGKRVHKRILVHYPVTDFGGSMWMDVLQLDFGQPVTRQWLNDTAAHLFKDFDIDAVRRDMAYYLLNGMFFPRWNAILSRELSSAAPEMQGALRDSLAAFQARAKAVGGKEELQAMVEAIKAAKPSGIVMDESYGFFTDLSRDGTDSVYNKNDHDVSLGQYGLYDAIAGRDAWKLGEAVRNIAFRNWQKGGATPVEFIGNHDETNPVDRFGKYFRVAALTALMFRPVLTYAGQERGVGRQAGLIADLSRSSDLSKDTPFDIPVLIKWAASDPANEAFLRRVAQAGADNEELLKGGIIDALVPLAGTPLVAWSASRVDPETGRQNALILAANFTDGHAGGLFQFQPVLPEFGAFVPRADRDYLLRDRLNVDSQGNPAVYRRSGRDLLSKGLDIELDSAQAQLFEVEEVAALAAGGLRGANGVVATPAPVENGGGPLTIPAKVFITRPGLRTEAVPLEKLGEFLAADPVFKSTLNKIGRFRVVLDKSEAKGGLTQGDVAKVQDILSGFGITAKLEVENISIEPGAPEEKTEAGRTPGSAVAAPAPEAGAQGGWFRRFVAGPFTAPFRTLAYLGRSLWTSFTAPATRTVLTGLVVKLVIPLLVLRQVGWMHDYGGHPTALALTLGMNLALSIFHGVFVRTWANFQNKIGKERGLGFQTIFNLAYGQFWGVLSRLITWTAGVRMQGKVPVPPWNWHYWKDVGIGAVFGSFFGTLGYLGVNTLYNNGRIRQSQRDIILLLRDLVMTLSGYFFGSGSMLFYWLLFCAQQSVDFGIYLISQRMNRYPVLYVADARVAAAPEFQNLYPVGPESANQESPLKQAWSSVLGTPFVKPIVWVVRKIRDWTRARNETQATAAGGAAGTTSIAEAGSSAAGVKGRLEERPPRKTPATVAAPESSADQASAIQKISPQKAGAVAKFLDEHGQSLKNLPGVKYARVEKFEFVVTMGSYTRWGVRVEVTPDATPAELDAIKAALEAYRQAGVVVRVRCGVWTIYSLDDEGEASLGEPLDPRMGRYEAPGGWWDGLTGGPAKRFFDKQGEALKKLSGVKAARVEKLELWSPSGGSGGGGTYRAFGVKLDVSPDADVAQRASIRAALEDNAFSGVPIEASYGPWVFYVNDGYGETGLGSRPDSRMSFYEAPRGWWDGFTGGPAKRFFDKHGDELKKIPGVKAARVEKLDLWDTAGGYGGGGAGYKDWGVRIEPSPGADKAAIKAALAEYEYVGVPIKASFGPSDFYEVHGFRAYEGTPKRGVRVAPASHPGVQKLPSSSSWLADVAARRPPGSKVSPSPGAPSRRSRKEASREASGLSPPETVGGRIRGANGVLESTQVRQPDLTPLPIGWDEVPPEPAEAPSSLKDVSLDIPPDAKFTPSPDDWRKEIIYSVVIDRFARSKPFKTWGDPEDARTRHGGNIRGVIDKLDYMKGLGVTTLLVNPLYMSPPASYIDYWPVHFMAVDPNIGTMADFQELVAQAHKRGMRIVLDMVFNHAGPILEYEDGWQFSHQPKKVKRWLYPVKPVELQDENNFHRRGSIDDWNNAEQVQWGDFPGGLNQLATERPETQDILLKIGKWWLKETDVDGFRLDTYKHVSPAFWTRFFQEIRDYAGKLGKNNFLAMGEIYDGNPSVILPELGHGRLGAAYNYPAYFSEDGALHGAGPTRWMEDAFHFIQSTLGDRVSSLVTFIDNQDKQRFQRLNDPVGVLRVAAAYVLLSIGIPFFYYGTEQAYQQLQVDWGMDGYREDMFPGGKFKNPASKGDDFKTDSPMYKHIRALTALRKAHPALSLGQQYVRWSDPNGPGIYAFSRIYQGEEVLVVMNTAGEARSAEMYVDSTLSPPGAALSDELDGGYRTAAHSVADGGSKVSVDVPAYGVRVLVRRKN